MIQAQPASAACNLVILKVGGSLLDWPELPGQLTRFLDQDGDREPCLRKRAALLAGGGPFADVIRVMDRTHGLGDEQAHRLAIRSLDLTAELLAALLPGSIVVHQPEDLRRCQAEGLLPILAPRPFLEKLDDRGPDALTASWDVTSDSIAARLAVRLGARHLLLLKSASLAADISRREAARLGLVDPMFPHVVSTLETVELVSLREGEPQRRRLTADPTRSARHS